MAKYIYILSLLLHIVQRLHVYIWWCLEKIWLTNPGDWGNAQKFICAVFNPYFHPWLFDGSISLLVVARYILVILKVHIGYIKGTYWLY